MPVKVLVAGTEGPPEYTSSSPLQPPETARPTDTRSGIVKRAMEKTAGKLTRTITPGSRAQLSQSQPSLPATSPKRIFGMSRKGKERSSTDGDGEQHNLRLLWRSHNCRSCDSVIAHSQLVGQEASVRSSGRRKSSSTAPQAEDDSPFITPRSPHFGPTRSLLNIFRGDGSVSTPYMHVTTMFSKYMVRCVPALRR